MENNKLPSGWKINKDGLFEYKMFPAEVKEMRKIENLIFALSVGNILQAMFIFILIISHFCNH